MPIKLKSSDGEVFDVDIEVAKASVTIKTMLEDLGVGENNDEIVPLPNVNSTILKKGKCRSMSSGCACVRSIWRSVIGPADIRSTWSPFCVFGVRFVRQSAENSIVLVSLDHPNSPTLSSSLHAVLLWANYHKNDPPIVEVSIRNRPALGALI